jgi:tetratricopeptide (TPR) repeat protein
LHLWDTEGAEPISLLERNLTEKNLPWPQYGRIVVSSDGSQIVWKQSRHVAFHDVVFGKTMTSKFDSDQEIRHLAISPDGKYLATGLVWTANVYEITSERLVYKYTVQGDSGPVMDIRFSEDGAWLAAAHWTSKARLYDVNNGNQVQEIRGHSGGVTSLAFSHDSSLLVTGGMDGTVRLWDLKAGKHRITMSGDHREVNALAFSRDNRTIAMKYQDGTIRFWATTSQAELEADPDYWVRRSRKNISHSRFRDALADLSEAIKLDPADQNLFSNLANYYIQQRGISKTVDLFAQLVEQQPENRELLKQHANLAARTGRWSEAAESLSKAIELDPTEHYEAFQLASVLLQNRDEEGYRKLRSELLKRWGSTTDPAIAERIAKVCLLLPAEGEELKTAIAMADLAIQAGPGHNLYRYFELAQGLAEYRNGDDYEAAVTVLQSSRSKFQKGGETYRAIDELLLAMSYQKLNQSDKAQELFQSAAQLILNDLPSLKDGDLGGGYHDTLFCWILHREASEVVIKTSYSSLLEAGDLADKGRDEEALDVLTKIEVSEDSVAFYLKRGRLYLRLQNLTKAADDYIEIAQLEPEKSSHWMKAASLLVAAGDIEGYRQLCTAALDRFGTSVNEYQTGHIVKICSILPQDDTILQRTTLLADEGIGANPTFEWVIMTSALSEYRRDNFKGAIQWGTQCLVISSEKIPNSKVHLNMAAISHFVQAMSYHRLDQPEQAEIALKKGLAVCNRGLPEYPAGGWWDSFITHALRREAEALLNGEPNPNLKSTNTPKP